MPILAPAHYEDTEFSKLPRKINDTPIAYLGLTMQEILMITGVLCVGFLLTFSVQNSLPLQITLVVFVVGTIVLMIFLFRYAHTVVKKFYWHNIKYAIDMMDEPDRWTGDAYAYAWGEDRNGNPVKGGGFKGRGDNKEKKGAKK